MSWQWARKAASRCSGVMRLTSSLKLWRAASDSFDFMQ